jgi:hypothetical protein
LLRLSRKTCSTTQQKVFFLARADILSKPEFGELRHGGPHLLGGAGDVLLGGTLVGIGLLGGFQGFHHGVVNIRCVAAL